MTIQYQNDTIIIGQVHGGKFIDIVRRFDRSIDDKEAELQTIESADGGILWERPKEIDAHVFKTRSCDTCRFKTIMTEDFENIYDCWENNKWY